MHRLFAHAGWGSALVEAQLAWYGMPFELEETGDLFKSEAARDRLRAVNPAAQLPTLVMPDGSVMTESAAITLLLAEAARSDALVPPPGDPSRAAFLRWLVFLVAAVYPTFTYGDDTTRWVSGEPAQKELRATTNAARERGWQAVEQACGAPWFLGARFSALDIYLCIMTRWWPRRAWFAENCPRIAAVAAAADRVDRLAPVIARNFP